jgi:hypothetical protein
VHGTLPPLPPPSERDEGADSDRDRGVPTGSVPVEQGGGDALGPELEVPFEGLDRSSP